MFSIVLQTARSIGRLDGIRMGSRSISVCHVNLTPARSSYLERYHSDLEFRCRQIEISKAKLNARYKDDPTWRNQILQRSRNYWKTEYHSNEEYQRRYRLRSFIQYHMTSGNQLTWKSHKPLFYSQSVEHNCSICKRNRRNARWWQRKDDPVLVDCNMCFMKDLSIALPEGVFFKGAAPTRVK